MTKRAFALILAATAGMSLSACGGNEPVPDRPAEMSSGAPGTSPLPDYPPVPTPEALNGRVAWGFDPAVPVGEKAAFVQGAEDDPALVEQVVAAAVENNAEVVVTSIDDLGAGSLAAGATLSIGGQPNPTTLIFVAEDGEWKLSRENACTIAELAGLTSASCAA
ncbi:MAG: hypothetical protein WBQ44_07785 [Rhodococcus sp. (in: high G+C Gram-positive bacteria)]